MLAQGRSQADTRCMHPGAAVMSQNPTRPVQVRLPEAVDEFLTELAHERGESKTSVVIEALDCLRQQELERRMETGYRELAGERRGESAEPGGPAVEPGSQTTESPREQDQLVRAALEASLPTIPD
jgi:hypothetical protein